MTTMADLDELALSVPHPTRDVSNDGRPAYLVDGKLFCYRRENTQNRLSGRALQARRKHRLIDVHHVSKPGSGTWGSVCAYGARTGLLPLVAACYRGFPYAHA